MTDAATILVVEDDRPLQDALVSTLVAAGYDVLAAGDGGEALKVLGEVERRPHRERRADATRRRARAAPAAPGSSLRAAGLAHDRLRHDRSGRRRDARRRGGLSREAVRGRGARAARRALCASSRTRGCTSRRTTGRRGCAQPRVARARRTRRAERSDRAADRRKRHRQRGVLAFHPRRVEAQRGTVRRGQLRRDPRPDARGLAVRARERRVHRRTGAQHRQVRAGERRHDPARRDHRDGPEPPGEASARVAGARGRAARGKQARAARRARACDEQPGPRGDGARRPVSRRSVLSAQRVPAADSAAARAARRRRGARRALLGGARPPATRCPPRRSRACKATRGPGTCASSRT